MADALEKENLAPQTSSDPLQHKGSSPLKKGRAGARSRSLGPGGLQEITDDAKKEKDKQELKNRRKSTYIPTTKSIISADAEKAARQAARRKTLANRRVSFAPEATLHTWDVIEFMRDQTTSTDSSETPRRESNATRGSPASSSPSQSVDEEDDSLLNSPDDGKVEQRRGGRRSSGIPPMNFNNPDDIYSSSGASGSSDVSESEGEEIEGSDDDTGTAMSLDVDEETMRSVASASSTSSSAQLEASLRQAATAAGTRGIHYDEFGEGSEASMELAGDTVTNAFKPWVQQGQENTVDYASADQENVNPFSAAYRAHIASGAITRQETIEEEDTGDMSMDETRAVGGIMRSQNRADQTQSSPFGDQTMEMTQAVGKIHASAKESPATRSSTKRRRSTTDTGSPGAALEDPEPKRRRSSIARSSMGDDTMDLTMAVGGIQKTTSPKQAQQPQRRRSIARRRSSGVNSDLGDATMEFTQAVGGIRGARQQRDPTMSDFDENEELTMEAMELTTAVGVIKKTGAANPSPSPVAQATNPSTPQASSPLRTNPNTTPKDQERFRDVPDSGPGKLLTPLLQKASFSAEKAKSSPLKPEASPIARRTRRTTAFAELNKKNQPSLVKTPENQVSPPKVDQDISYPELPAVESVQNIAPSPVRSSPAKSPVRTPKDPTPSPATVQLQLNAQLEASPVPNVPARSSPLKAVSTPEKSASPEATRMLAASIKKMNTPRKEMLKNVTPKKPKLETSASPQRATPTPLRRGPVPRYKPSTSPSPAKPVSHELLQVEPSDEAVEKLHLQEFLDLAGIRFMELTTTNRRLTTAPTPSKARKSAGLSMSGSSPVDLEGAVVAAACTTPELEMFRHACNELRRYIKDGKQAIKELESETYTSSPPLIRAYQLAGDAKRAELDALMREIKTQARLRSKEIWYGWRTSLMEDLMKPLTDMGEGLLKDDEYLQKAESILQQALPGLVEKQETLQLEAERLEEEVASVPDHDKQELDSTRQRLLAVDTHLAEKRKLLEELERQSQEQEALGENLVLTKTELVGAIREADRVREACRGVPLDEIAKLKESIKNVEDTYGWSIASASSSPTTVTMTYKGQLQLFFHPEAFQGNHFHDGQNASIGLTYVAKDRHSRPKELTTTLRFFLQSLRASLHGLQQSSTRILSLLTFVSNGWEQAMTVAEMERRISIETMTESRIVSDDRIALEATILLPKVRTKVRVSFGLSAAVNTDFELVVVPDVAVKVLYGQPYDEPGMSKWMRGRIGDEKEIYLEGWDEAVRDLKDKLVLQGLAKSARG